MRNALKAPGLVVLFVVALLGCSKHRVDPEQAKKMVASGARLVDVRSVEEYEAGHLDGAVNIPVDEIEKRAGELEPKSQGVVVYCAHGFRSAKAAKALASAGFSD